MSRKKKPKRHHEEPASLPEKTPQAVVTRYVIALAGVALMIVAFVVCMRLLDRQDSSRRSERATSTRQQDPQTTPVAAESETPDEKAEAEDNAAPDPTIAEKLVGSWRRTEGNYVIEIKSVDESGVIEAAYYNPQPINVSKAEATQPEEAVQVFIELRDVNYPGSTYRLEYDSEQDQLAGTYFQATHGQEFPVTFIRLR
jgi:hypothetical protein